jgi:tetratricopeptide (TPR) repeat protein
MRAKRRGPTQYPDRLLRVHPVTRLSRGLFLILALGLLGMSSARAQGYGGTVEDMLARGDILLSQGKANEAIVQFQDARTLCPTPAQLVESLRGEGRARLVMGELLQAAGLFEEAATVFPEDPRIPDLFYAAGSTSYRAGDMARAADLLRRALDSNPTPDLTPRVQFHLSQALRMTGRPSEVVELLEGFEDGNPKHSMLPNVLYTLAISHHDLGDLDTSEEIYRNLMERFVGTPSAIEAHFELAGVLAEKGRSREAAQYFRQYVDLNPGSEFAPKALERAADLLLFRSPKESVELYALARVKEKMNPRPRIEAMQVGSWMGAKATLAGILSRVWILVIVGGLLLVGLAFLARLVVRKRWRAMRTDA